MDFEKRLEKAIDRGKRSRDELSRKQNERTLSEEELKSQHSKCRIELSEHIDGCLKKLSEHFPGFDFETVVDEDGWGAVISRDDFRSGRNENHFSRLRMVIRPYSSANIVELVARGTIRNKEALNRNHYQFLSQTDLNSFKDMIDLWVLEYAEKYSATK